MVLALSQRGVLVPQFADELLAKLRAMK